jgi:hypothetical protein
MNYNYNNYKVTILPQQMTWANTGAGTVALVFASDIGTLNKTAADTTPILNINIGKSVRQALGLGTQVSMKINSIQYGYLNATADLEAHTAEGHKLTCSTSTGLVTAATVALSGTLGVAQTTGKLVTLTPATPVTLNSYQDFNLEVTIDAAGTSAYKVTSIIVDCDIIDL